MTIAPRIENRLATCGGTPHVLATSMTKEFITEVECSSARVLRNPGHVRMIDRDGTTTGDCNVAVRYPFG